MDVTVRLYKLHDYDLIYLQRIFSFPVKDAMKMALASYVRNEPVFFHIPVAKIEEKMETDHLATKQVQFHIKLREPEDEDLIIYLKGLKKNYRNAFLKNLLRGYLAGPVAYVYEKQNIEPSTKARYQRLEDNILQVKELKPMKLRKKRKKHIILTKGQKRLFDYTGALDDEVEVIIK